MSIFNEKDQYFKNCFSEQFADSDSDDDNKFKETNISAVSEGDNTSDTQIKSNELIQSTPKSTGSKDETKALGETSKISTDSKLEYITISSGDDSDTIDIDDDDKNFEIQEILMSSHKSNQPPTEQPSSSSLNNSILGDEPMELKVMIAGEYRRFPTSYGASLYDAFRSYIQDLRQSGKTLIVTLNGKQIPLNQSALDLDINQGTILLGVECSKSILTEPEGDVIRSVPKAEDPNLIIIKLQDGNQRNTKEIKISKTDPLIELKKKYAQLLNIKDITSFKLKFDGDAVDEDETPIDLDLEGGEALDVIFK